tara:strand:- start:271 stop:498 length:228 start_codon:yes stop_codon:yes gene_type:complete
MENKNKWEKVINEEKALNNLLKNQGLKKQDPLEDYSENAKNLAQFFKITYDAFITVGFTEKQSLYLVNMQIGGKK